MFPIKKIVAPTDFSAPATEGLKAAIEMATKFDAQLLVIHIVGTVPSISGTHLMSSANAIAMVDEMREEAQERIETLIRSKVPEHIPCKGMVADGHPADEIIRMADEEGADLIVIATHGYSGLERFLFGSVAERVLRKAQCPVLSIRPRSAKDSSS